MFRLIIIFASLLIFYLSQVFANGESDWGYKNLDTNKQISYLPEDWHKFNPACQGELQSPINIEFGNTKYDSKMGEIHIQHKADSGDHWNITNDGKTVKLTPTDGKFSFVMHPQNVSFNLLQMHFHWRGSEHYVDDHKYSAEVHLVFQSEIDPNQYSVVGYMFKLINKDNLSFQALFDQIKTLQAYNSGSQFNVRLEDMLPMKVSNYFRYAGSLTTPGCNEIVEWNVVDSPILGLSENQLLEFQSLLNSAGMPILSNSRPIQNIYDRVVRRSFYPFGNKQGVEARRQKDRNFGYENEAQGVRFMSLTVYCMLISACYFIMA